MRRGKFIDQHKIDRTEFLDIEQALDERRRYPEIFFPDEIKKNKAPKLRIDDFFNRSSYRCQNKNDFLKEFQVRNEICWLFIEYFFTSSNKPLKKFMGFMERNIILRTLYKANGNQAEAARILGIKSTTLNEKIKRYEIRIR